MTKRNDSADSGKPIWQFSDDFSGVFAHDSGSWAKKYHGRLRYFGRWQDGSQLDAVIELKQSDPHWSKGVDVPISESGAPTVGGLVRKYQQKKLPYVLVPQTLRDEKQRCRLMLELFPPKKNLLNINTDDFDRIANIFNLRVKANKDGHGDVAPMKPKTRNKYMLLIQGMFRWAVEEGLLDEKPRYGTLWKTAAAGGKKIINSRHRRAFTAADIRLMLAESIDDTMRAMIWLGVTLAMNNGDVANLRRSKLPKTDDGTGWLTYPRNKTDTPRELFIVSEAAEALAGAHSERPKARAAQYDDFVFLTRRGLPMDYKGAAHISRRFTRFFERLGVHQTRSSFGTFRHVFISQAGNITRDRQAVENVSGHVYSGSADNYDDAYDPYKRNLACIEGVRDWVLTDGAADDQFHGLKIA